MAKEEEQFPQMSTIDDLYYALVEIYSCKYADKPEEVDRSKAELFKAIQDGRNPYDLIRKMKQLKSKLRRSGDFESKLSSHICERFWVKDFSDQQIPYRPWKPE
jgi:hypothetical protein